MVEYSHEQEMILQIINISSNSLSVIGCLFIIFLYWTAYELRGYIFKLVFLLAIGDLIKSLMTILANLPLNLPDMMCSIEGFVMDASCLSTFV